MISSVAASPGMATPATSRLLARAGLARPSFRPAVLISRTRLVRLAIVRAQRVRVGVARRAAPLSVRCNSTLNAEELEQEKVEERFKERKEVIDSRSKEIDRLLTLKGRLASAGEIAQKAAILDECATVRDVFSPGSAFSKFLEESGALLGQEDMYLLKLATALGQGHVFTQLADASLHAEPSGRVDSLSELLAVLRAAESFYDIVGGLLGYQLTTIELIQTGEVAAFRKDISANATARAPLGSDPGPPPLDAFWEVESADFSHAEDEAEQPAYCVPPGINLIEDEERAVRFAFKGLEASPALAEIYPLGGAGDRLGLHCAETGSPLPAAVLPYTGRSLLSCLIRDLQAREYLYYKLFGKQLNTPVAIMTSAAKGNHRRVTELCLKEGWFGRGQDSFRLFQQSLVPVVGATEGRWAMDGPGAPALKPGGHGVIWKLAQDVGVLSWLEAKGCVAGLVRQISNPLAATDTTMLALAGVGFSGNRRLGFASCDRAVGASEGMNVLLERRTPSGGLEYNISCIEYTEFDRLGIVDVPMDAGSGSSAFPANTNVLYVKLDAVRAALAQGKEGCLPGMIVNLSKPVQSFGDAEPVRAGRLECSMQCIADLMGDPAEPPSTSGSTSGSISGSVPGSGNPAGGAERWEQLRERLSTFVVYSSRRKVTSSAKKRRKAGDRRLAQTPDGSYLDYLRNCHEILRLGGVAVPEVAPVDAYLARGPNLLLRFHPALGPLWHVAAQKVRRGSVAEGSELELEVAEADIDGLALDGSLRIIASAPLGPLEPSAPNPATATGAGAGGVGGGEGELLLRYDDTRAGRVRMRDVTVKNAGVDWENEGNVFWSAQVARRESLVVNINGSGEFDAEGVSIVGGKTFDVPDRHRLVLRPLPAGAGAGGERYSEVLKPLGALPSWRWAYKAPQGDESGRITLSVEKPSAVSGDAPSAK